MIRRTRASLARSGAIALLVALATIQTGSASAQECLFLRNYADRLGCANPTLRASNAAMRAAYDAFAARAPAATRPRLAAAQRHWQALRDRACDVRRDWEDEAKLRCLITMTDRRRAALAADRTEGELISGEAGAEPLAVDTLITSARRRCTVVMRVPRLGRFGHTRFESAMRAAAFPPTSEAARTCSARNRQFAYHDYDLDFRVTWHSARIVAVTFDEYVDTGNAHPVVSLSAVTYDFTAGRVLTLADVADGARGRDGIVAACRAMVAAEIGNDAAIDEQRFAAIAGDLSAWTVEPSQATISFNPGTIVAGPAPGISCTLPLATLRPFLRPGNPLW